MFPICQSRGCSTTWWVVRLCEGDLPTQLHMMFGRAGGAVLASLPDSPRKVSAPAYLQIVISPRELHLFKGEDRWTTRAILTKLLTAA